MFLAKLAVVIIVSSMACSTAGSTQLHLFGVPSFSDPEYFITKIVRNTGVKPDTKSKFAQLFITRIKAAAKKDPNFAGRYSLTSWGCGTSCRSGAVINLVTGEVIELPTSSWGYEFRIHSALLILNPLAEGELAEERPWYGQPEYYLFNGKEFLEF